MMAADDPWAVLGVDPSASLDEVRASYRELLALYHPDRHAGSPQNIVDRSHDMTRRINEAWVAIRDGVANPPGHLWATVATADESRSPASDPSAPVPGLTRAGRVWLPPASARPIASKGAMALGFSALPPGPVPHPNTVWVDRGLAETRTALVALARSMGLRNQPKASPQWLLFTRGVMSVTGVIVHLTEERPGRTLLEVKGHQRINDLLQEFFVALRRDLPAIVGEHA